MVAMGAVARLGWLLGAILVTTPAGADVALVEVAPGVLVAPGVHEELGADNQGGIANLGVVIGARAVAVIDSGGSRMQGEALLAAIRRHTALPISHVINTHAHPDHVFGNAAFVTPTTTFVGHANLPRAMAERGPFYLDNLHRLLGEVAAGTELVAPGLVVADHQRIDLGDRELTLVAHATGHTDADLTVLDHASGTLFAGDLLFMERIPVVDGSLNGWLAVLDRLRTTEALRVVPGHGPPSAPWPEALEPQRRYLETLRDRLRLILADGVPLGRAVEAVPAGTEQRWLLSEDNHPRNVITSYAELEWE
jgi:quinoprotein relay system zinc metallohydrolase 2